MNKKGNARSAAATAKRASENKGGALYPHCNFNTEKKRKQCFVESVLFEGEKNALTIAELQKQTGLSREALRIEITAERKAGAPILSKCTGNGGYFLPQKGSAGQLEVAACVRTLQARGIRTLRTARRLENHIKNLDGQISISDTE